MRYFIVFRGVRQGALVFCLGPVVAKKLIAAGIETPEQLRSLGAKEAFLRIHRSGGFCGEFHASYLYALEGAILNCDWREIPEQKKRAYRQFTEVLRAGTA